MSSISNWEREFFIPDHFKWLIITKRRYDKLPIIPNWEGNYDLHAIVDDEKNVKKGD